MAEEKLLVAERIKRWKTAHPELAREISAERTKNFVRTEKRKATTKAYKGTEKY
jgi:hypothetical protein